MYQTPQIERFLRGIIVAKLTDLLGELKRSLFDLPALYDEIGAGVRAKCQDDFENLGVALKTLYVNSISPTEEAAKAIDERAAMGAIGDMQAYLQFKTARGIGDAAAASGEGGGGLAGAGVGLGAGVGMGAAMAQAMTEAMRPRDSGEEPKAVAATINCHNCGATIPADSKFCNNCGAKQEGKLFCSQCGAELPPGSKFCNNCGTKIE
jgi:membrane protease subunit (stomatin/prohibitin family)